MATQEVSPVLLPPMQTKRETPVPPGHTQIYIMGFCRHLLLQVDADLTLAWNVFPRLTT